MGGTLNAVVEVQEATFSAMGTEASLLVVADDEREFRDALCDVTTIMNDVDSRFNVVHPESELSAIRRGEIADADISEDMQRVLDGCRIVEAMTDGAFRPRTPKGELDPSGFAKGWGIKRAGAALVGRGLADWCLTVGGDVLTSGQRDQRDWHVAISHPVNSSVAAVLAVSGAAVATSGTRSVDPRVVGQAHIWDLDGKLPSTPGSMTVVGPSIDIADALATGCWALGDDAFDVLAKLPEYHLMKVEQDRVLVSDGFPYLAEKMMA
jgi:thiamine biosynthesis lipoprotein